MCMCLGVCKTELYNKLWFYVCIFPCRGSFLSNGTSLKSSSDTLKSSVCPMQPEFTAASIFWPYSKQPRHFTETPLGGFLLVLSHCDLTLCITCNLSLQFSVFLTLTEKSLVSAHQPSPGNILHLCVHPAWLSYIILGHKYNISVPRLFFWRPVFRFGGFS